MVLKLIGVNPSAPFAPILSNMPVKYDLVNERGGAGVKLPQNSVMSTLSMDGCPLIPVKYLN